MKKTRAAVVCLLFAACAEKAVTTPDGDVAGTSDMAVPADLAVAVVPDLSPSPDLTPLPCKGTVDDCGAPGACMKCPDVPNGTLTCDNQVCKYTCKTDPGIVDCAPAASVCAKVDSDPKNCGFCQHDCGPGACVAGACQPFVIAKATEPVGIVADAKYADYADHTTNKVYRVDRNGAAAPTVFADSQQGPTWLAIDTNNLYWVNTTGGTVMALSLMAAAGTAPTVLAMGQGGPVDLATDGTSVYWLNGMAGTVMKVATTGGAATTLASNQTSPQRISLDDTAVYWVNDDSTIETVPKAGGAPTALVPNSGARGNVVVLAGEVFYASIGRLMSLPVAGGQPRQRSSKLTQVGSMAGFVLAGTPYVVFTDLGFTGMNTGTTLWYQTGSGSEGGIGHLADSSVTTSPTGIFVEQGGTAPVWFTDRMSGKVYVVNR